ncbi:amino acid permease [Streptomyces sp. KR55]|uniref:amino acid permease n=1 Tax=Streptomyces sp. KR55 TaxID=3457425 RepID=UPI003FD68E53
MLTWPTGILAGMALLVLFFVLNIFGVHLLAKVNTWVTLWKILIPTVTFVLLLFAFDAGNINVPGGHVPNGPGGILQAITVGGIAFAYLGSRQVLDYGGESRNPRRDIPLAVILSVLIPMIIYLGLQVGFLAALDWADAGVVPGDWAGLTTSDWASSPLFSALGAAGFTSLIQLFAIVFAGLAVYSAYTAVAGGWISRRTG